MRVIAFTKYDRLAASTRQRFLQYRPLFSAAGIDLVISPLLGNDHVARLERGRAPRARDVAHSYLRRARAVVAARNFDIAWIHCELFPYMPGWFEAAAAAAPNRIVFDFDDAIFHMYDENASPAVRFCLQDKLVPLLRRASAATCGNAYLRDYAARYCDQSLIVPTVVNTEIYKPIHQSHADPPLIGWIGSASTWHNVRQVLPVLRDLCATGRARFRAIGAGVDAQRDIFPGMELVPWSEQTEVAEVQGFNIGIMPLIDAPFQRGKSGYKLVQYMACGIPAVTSPVGVNASIVANGAGVVANDLQGWKNALERLVDDADLRQRMGNSGRNRAVEHYSLEVYAPRLIELFKEVRARAPARVSSSDTMRF